jgi:endonuclease/exonuclease/phosphatase family metal-dependent hydrolase
VRTGGVVLLLLATAATVRCGAKRDAALPAAPVASSCRELIDLSGRPAMADVRWHSAPDSAEQRRLTAWCGTVGPGVFAGARDPHTAPASVIAVLSWNVHVGAGQLSAVIGELRRGRFTGGTAPAGFVLLLQEAVRGGAAVPETMPHDAPVPDRIAARSGSGGRDDVVMVADQEGLALLYLPSMRNGRETSPRSEDRGNAILSTFELADPIGIELPLTRHRRVAVAATVGGIGPDGQSWRLRVVSLHLDASTGPRQFWLLTSAQRERQARHVVDVLDDDPVAMIVGGDLNTWAGGTREPAFIELKREFPRAGIGGRFARLLTLDYLFFRVPSTWHTASQPADSAFGSDHRPIVSLVRLGS